MCHDESGKRVWLLDEPGADATWHPDSGVLVVHVEGGEAPELWASRVAYPVREGDRGARVQLDPHAELAQVQRVVAVVAEGDAWRDRHCSGCGAAAARLVRLQVGITGRLCEPCELLAAEERALAPGFAPSPRDAVEVDLDLWGRLDIDTQRRRVADLGRGRPQNAAWAWWLRTAPALLLLPLWPAWTGRGVWIVAGLWIAAGVSLWTGPPWLPWAAGGVLGFVHLLQWAVALGALQGSNRRPGWPRKLVPELFELADRASTQLGVASVQRIELAEDMTVTGHDRVYDDGPTRVLTVGRAAIALLSPEELELLMALALAAVGSRRRVAWRFDNWTDRWHRVLTVAEVEGSSGVLSRFARAVLPELMTVRAALWRSEVVPADRRVAEVYGASRVARALVRQGLLSRLLAQALFKAGTAWATDDPRAAPRFEGALARGLASLRPRAVQAAQQELLWSDSPWWAAVPALAERLAALEVEVGAVDVRGSANALPLRRDAGLDRLDGWLLQRFRQQLLRRDRAVELLAAEPPDHVAAWVRRAALFTDVVDHRRVGTSLGHALALEPSHTLAHRARLVWVGEVGTDAERETVARHTLAMCRDAVALESAASVLRQLGDLVSARDALTLAAELATSRAERSRLAADAARVQREMERSSASPGFVGPSFQMKPSNT